MFSFNSLFFMALATNLVIFSSPAVADVRKVKQVRRKLPKAGKAEGVVMEDMGDIQASTRSGKSARHLPTYNVIVAVERDDQTYLPAMKFNRETMMPEQSLPGSQLIFSGNAYANEVYEENERVGFFNQQCTIMKGTATDGIPPVINIEHNMCHFNLCVSKNPELVGRDDEEHDCLYLRSGGSFPFEVFNGNAEVPDSKAYIVGGTGVYEKASGKATISTIERQENNGGVSLLKIAF